MIALFVHFVYHCHSYTCASLNLFITLWYQNWYLLTVCIDNNKIHVAGVSRMSPGPLVDWYLFMCMHVHVHNMCISWVSSTRLVPVLSRIFMSKLYTCTCKCMYITETSSSDSNSVWRQHGFSVFCWSGGNGMIDNVVRRCTHVHVQV